ncbi:hypothetical protein PPS11_37795 [Pseudomonas putida S11]|nr:hypothetical protein PPS11_37795 [Pseudomonas putida S11]
MPLASCSGSKQPLFDQFTEMLPADHADIQEWFADDVVENSLNQLKQSDLDMIRVLEDLIDVLTAKGVFKITDLAPRCAGQAAQPFYSAQGAQQPEQPHR